jgi:ketosteroid isomerase-like protein
MSAEQNLRIVQEAYSAFLRGDIEAVLSTISDDIVFTIPGPPQMPTAGTWRGLAGMRQFFAKLTESVEFTAFNAREYVASGDRVIVLGDYTGRVKRNNKTVFSEWVIAWRMRDGKTVEFREYNDTLAIAEAFDALPRAAAG